MDGSAAAAFLNDNVIQIACDDTSGHVLLKGKMGIFLQLVK